MIVIPCLTMGTHDVHLPIALRNRWIPNLKIRIWIVTSYENKKVVLPFRDMGYHFCRYSEK